MTFNPSNTLSPFLQTTVFFPEQFEEFRSKFLQLYFNIANNVNIRGISIFESTESLTGEQWNSTTNSQLKRQTFRKVFIIGAIAAGATSTTAHNIPVITEFTHIYGTATTDVVDYRPIPYASATLITDQIQLTITPINIVIVNGATAPNITSAIVVLEYFKN